MKHFIFLSLITLLFVASTLAGAPTNQPAVGNIALMVDTNGNLVAPTNFYRSNLAKMDEAGLATDAELALVTNNVADIQLQLPAVSNIAQAAYDLGLVNSNGIVNVSNSWWSSVAFLILAADTNRWNAADLTATAVSNEVDALQLQLPAVSNIAQAAYDLGLVNSNGIVNVSNSWWSSVAFLILADDTNRWNAAESDPLAIHFSSTYTAWTDDGGTYTASCIAASSPLLTNGLTAITYDSAGNMSVLTEMSTDSNAWVTASATNGAVYLRISITNNLPIPTNASHSISNIVLTSWTRPDLWRKTSDTAGQIILVDNPSSARQVVNKQTLDASVASVTPANWSTYPATENVRLDGKRLIMTDGWSVTQTGGVGIVSYADVWATSNALSIAHNGVELMRMDSGTLGLHINAFTILDNIVTLWASTNGISSEPIPQFTADFQVPTWEAIACSNSYPNIVSDPNTNDAYKIEFALPAGDSGFFRGIQQSGDARVELLADLLINNSYPWRPQTNTVNESTLSTPRWIGDELVIHTSTNVIYRAFGLTTNDWIGVWGLE